MADDAASGIPATAAQSSAASADAGLNAQQAAAVTHGDGPLLIVAGAGTGKTTVITRRAHWLITSGRAKPDGVLALTFTDKAAGEMAERLDRLLPYGTLDPWVMTFHAFCQRLLAAHGLEIGLADASRLLDATQQWLRVRRHFERFALDHYRPLGNPTKFIHALLRHFSRAKDEAISPEEYLAFAKGLQLNTDGERFLSQILGEDERAALSAQELRQVAKQELAKVLEVAEAYHTYHRLLAEEGVLDFGDLITQALRLLRERPAVLARYRAQFSHLLVDEFQDTNWAQYELVKLLAEPRRNVTVVGDDDQAIYKFRGASVANILQFKHDYPGARQVLLTTNYRSRQNILDLAYGFIQRNNPERLEVALGEGVSKRLVASREGIAPVEHLAAATASDEVRSVVEKIVELKAADSAVTWSDFAILVRANDHAEAFTYGLDAAGIPYHFVASRGLYRKAVVLDVVAFLKLLDDYREGPAMYRYLSWPVWALVPRTLADLTYAAKRRAQSLHHALQLAAAHGSVAEEDRERLQRALKLLDTHAAMARQRTVREVALSALEQSGTLAWLGGRGDLASQQSVSYLNQFFTIMADFEATAEDRSVRAFLEYLRLQQEAGESGPLQFDPDQGPEAVRVMTVHAAKGLEFRYVFVVNLVDRRFPTAERADPIPLPEGLIREPALPHGDVHLQEERRLFYVACTRAKDGLWLSSAATYGGTRARKPSQFLLDLGIARPPAAAAPTGRVVLPEPGEPVAVAGGSREHYRMPPRLSFSQLRSYDLCPWQYRFKYLLQIPVRGKGTLSFGNSIHLTLQRFFALVMQRQAAKQGGLFDGLEGAAAAGGRKTLGELASAEELLKLYDEAWVDEWYDSPQDRDEHRRRGRDALAAYYERLRGTRVRPQHLEVGLQLKLPDEERGAMYAISCKIDRVDQNDDGSYSIVDYKTGAAKADLSSDDKQQLLIYQLAARSAFDVQVRDLTFEYLEAGTRQTFLGSDRDLAELQRKVLASIHEIERGEFVATPGPVCKFCDYRDICEFRQF